MFSRVFFGIFLILSITGCSLPGTQSEGAVGEGLISYAGSGFSLSLPEDWNTSGDKNLPIPKNGKVALTAISPEVRYGFSNNIIILEDTLDVPITSKRYSELNNIQTTRNYLEYTKLSDEALLYSDDDEARIYVFEARYNTTTQRMKFVQTAKVCGTTVYLMHAAIALDKDAGNYVNLLKSFQCK